LEGGALARKTVGKMLITISANALLMIKIIFSQKINLINESTAKRVCSV
jgi:hypothetical protein